MKILIACEFSGTVRDAFAAKGHDAWSCDILPSEKAGQHIQGDVLEVLNKGWDMMIAHPPCTYLANSGVQHIYIDRKKEKGICPKRWQNMLEGAEFFKKLLNAPIKKIAVENPVQFGYAAERIGVPYSQIIQPYFFGDEVQKKTCLWLKNLSPLIPTKIVGKGEQYFDKNGKPNGSKWYQLPPSVDRWKHRSKTFQGIADAMAEQWSDF